MSEQKSETIFLKQGAEAILYVGEYENKECLIKERFQKKYRHPTLDESLTKRRMRSEVNSIKRCVKAGILVPELYKVDFDERKLSMEYLEKSITVKSYIIDKIEIENSLEHKDKLIVQLSNSIGTVIGKLHLNNIIHGDLTTSNMLINPKVNDDDFTEYDLIMIDFGLAWTHTQLKNKAVDLYVFERALSSTHASIPHLFSLVYESYLKIDTENSSDFVKCYEEVRARGRKRTMIG